MSFSQNLSRLQAARGESNYRLAKEMRVSQSTIANWRSGKIRPIAVYAQMLAEHFGVSVEELLADNEPDDEA